MCSGEIELIGGLSEKQRIFRKMDWRLMIHLRIKWCEYALTEA
jgi:hypothetical protein